MKMYLINVSFQTKDGLRGDLIYVNASTLEDALTKIRETGYEFDSYTFVELTKSPQVISRMLY